MDLRKFRNLTLAALLAGAGWFGVHQDAQAADFAEVSFEQMVDASNFIVRATVNKIWTEQDASGKIWTRAEVTITDSYKGALSGTIVVDSLGGSYGDDHIAIWGMTRFSPNEDTLLFVEQLDNGRLGTFGMYNGKYTIRRAARDTRHHVLKWHGNPSEKFDHRFLPHPAPEKRVYFNDMVDRIEARVAAGWDGKPVPGVSMEKLREINVTRDGGLQ